MMGDLLQPWHIIVLMMVFGLFFLLPYIFYILTLQRALEKCAPTSRNISPGMVWLLLIPLFNLVWHFLVVLGMAKSLENEFRRRNAPSVEPLPGQSIGIAMCVCACCCIIPILGFFAALAHFILWIIYWVKIAEFSRTLSMLPEPMSSTPTH
jgi:cytochrome c biogenesis protein CcdA